VGRHCFHSLGVNFRVDELLDFFDLQAPVFVGDDSSDADRFAVDFDLERRLYLSRVVSYDLSRGFYDGVDGSVHLGPPTDDMCDLFAPLLSVLLWHLERFWEYGVGEVVVQGFRETVDVEFFESLMPPVHEFGLWGLGIGARHWDEVIEGVEGSWVWMRQATLRRRGFIYRASKNTFPPSHVK